MKNLIWIALVVFAVYMAYKSFRSHEGERELGQAVEKLPTRYSEFAAALKEKKPMLILPVLTKCPSCDEHLKTLGQVYPQFAGKLSVVYLRGGDTIALPSASSDSLSAVIAACRSYECLYDPETNKTRGLTANDFVLTSLRTILLEATAKGSLSF